MAQQLFVVTKFRPGGEDAFFVGPISDFFPYSGQRVTSAETKRPKWKKPHAKVY